MLCCFPVFKSACYGSGRVHELNHDVHEPQHYPTTSRHRHEPFQRLQRRPNASTASPPNQQQPNFFKIAVKLRPTSFAQFPILTSFEIVETSTVAAHGRELIPVQIAAKFVNGFGVTNRLRRGPSNRPPPRTSTSSFVQLQSSKLLS